MLKYLVDNGQQLGYGDAVVAQGQWPEFKFLHTKLYTI